MNRFTPRLQEIRCIVHLAWPILIAQLAQHAIGFVDTLMSARAGTTDLAAIALGNSIWLPLTLAFSGILMATTPLVAHQVGAGREPSAADPFKLGLIIALILSALALLALGNSRLLLDQMTIEPALADKTARYLSAISWGTPALLLFQVIRGLNEGFGHPRPVMRIALVGLLCNIPLNYLLIFGKLGLPALGGVGCGYASSLVMWIMLSLGLLHLARTARLAPVRHNLRRLCPQPGELINFLRLGAPIGVALLIEASMFCVIALLIANDGAVVVAAHQITFSISELTFMLPLSIAMALTIRTGHLNGAQRPLQARFSAFSGILLALLTALASYAILNFGARWIASAYTDNPEITALSVQLLGIAALFQFVDGIQVTAAGALRGYKDTGRALLCVFVAYWVIGLPAGHYLARTLELGVAGYWYGLLTGLASGAFFLTLRLNGISHVSTLPDTAGTPDRTERLQQAHPGRHARNLRLTGGQRDR